MKRRIGEIICAFRCIMNEIDYADKNPDKVNLDDLISNIKCHVECLALYFLSDNWQELIKPYEKEIYGEDVSNNQN